MAAASAQTKLLRAIFTRGGFSFRSLARATQRAPRTIELIFDGDFHALRPKTAHRIEQAIGEAIWNDSQTFNRRRAVIEWLGFDPYDTGFWSLREKVKPLGIHIPNMPRRRAAADAAIEAAFDTAQAAIATKTAKIGQGSEKDQPLADFRR